MTIIMNSKHVFNLNGAKMQLEVVVLLAVQLF